MKKIMFRLSLLILMGLNIPVVAVSHSAQLNKGQKIFKKKMRRYCGFSGVRFARNHTPDEWEEIWDDGKFQEETKKICPRLKLEKIKKSWWEPVYEFTHEYGKGGSHVPHC
jgi:hypothetical protein